MLPHSNTNPTHLAYEPDTQLRAQVNVDAAEPAEQVELLTRDGAPYCFSEAGETLKCPVTAARTIRAGVYELQARLH